MSPYSEEYFHFVGRNAPEDNEANYGTLRSILTSGIVKGGSGGHRVTYTRDKSIIDGMIEADIACFCEIPPHGLDIHMSKYGRFGLSFNRQWIARWGARPAFYFPYRSDDFDSIHGTVALQDIEVAYRTFRDFHPLGKTKSRAMGRPATDAESAVHILHEVILKNFFAHIKTFNSELTTEDAEYFYAEREWRTLGNVHFKPEDVQTIGVAKGYRSRIISEFPEFSNRVLEL